VPDSQFLKLNLQSQWARRLNLLDSQTILRIDGQISNDPLLGLEQFGVGGRWTVRGYRENTLIRDNAIVASAEWRIPLLRDERGISRFEIRPFFDWSYSDNNSRQELRRNTLSAVGLGLYWSPVDSLQAEVYWGEPLQTVEYPGDYSLQDDGIFFSFSWETP
jgi:hemolysin activation/secretion protein